MRSRPSYEDLTLKVEPSPEGGTAVIRVLRSPSGHCQATAFEPPFPDSDPLRLLRSLEASIWRSGQSAGTAGESTRHVSLATAHGSQAPVEPDQIGRALFASLFTGPVRENLLGALALVGSRPDLGLRIRLVLDPTASGLLSAWPWELLYRWETRDFFARDLRTPVVRQLEVQRAALTPVPLDTLRVLVALSNPDDVTRLDVESERRSIEDAIGSVPGVDLRFLERPTIEGLRQETRDRPFDVLHFVGHGDLDSSGRGTLMFENSEGHSRPISGTSLADTLKGLQPIRLVLLNACETARLPRDSEGKDPYLGTASALIMAGVPAVVAMQFPISDHAALAFSGAFYRNLAAGDPLESAVTEGRLAIFNAQPESWEWATPVLFLGVPTGELFEVPTQRLDNAEQPAQSRATPSDSVEKALDLFERQLYDRSLEALQTAREVDPEDARIPYYQALARLQGRRPRTARLDVIRRIEADLDDASYLAPDGEPAHFWYLQALIKEDFYRFKGMRIRSPSVEQTLDEARAAVGEAGELQRLLDHVPSPPSPVRSAIEARLHELS